MSAPDVMACCNIFFEPLRLNPFWNRREELSSPRLVTSISITLLWIPVAPMLKSEGWRPIFSWASIKFNRTTSAPYRPPLSMTWRIFICSETRPKLFGNCWTGNPQVQDLGRKEQFIFEVSGIWSKICQRIFWPLNVAKVKIQKQNRCLLQPSRWKIK